MSLARTASSCTGTRTEKAYFHDPVVMLYAPLRTLIYIDSADRICFAVDSQARCTRASPIRSSPNSVAICTASSPSCSIRSASMQAVDASARRQTADFEQFEPQRLDLREHAVERGLVGKRTSQRGVVAVRPGLEGWKRGADRVAQTAADTDLEALGLRILARASCLLTTHRRTRCMFREWPS
jgi:hypothetical protein